MNQPLKARKRFGQNFLQDENIIHRIIQAINPKPEQAIVEIGPGHGALTDPLLEKTNGKLTVVELDRDLIASLRVKYFQLPQLTIVEGDALKVDFSQLFEAEPLRLVGNLPYNISTPLLFHLMQYANHIGDMHFMLQKEVVERMAAAVGSKVYGRLSIMIQYHCQVQPLFVVPPSAFTPAPKVDSMIVRLTPLKEAKLPLTSLKTLENIVRDSFSQRRKVIRNTLKKYITADALQTLAIDPGARAENLALKDFIAISNYISEQNMI